MISDKITITSEIWKEYAPLYARFTPPNQEELLKSISKLARGRVLDAGTGVGKAIPYLIANKKVGEIIAIDINLEMIKVAREVVNKLGRKNVTIFETDVNEILKIEGKFDTIFLTNVGYTIPNLIPVFKNIYSKLNTGGIFLFSNPKRSIDVNAIDKKIRENPFFSGPQYDRYIEINQILGGQNSVPTTYNTSEIVDILRLVGFKIEENSVREDFYYGNLFSISAEKF